jgi:hypothetical protein
MNLRNPEQCGSLLRDIADGLLILFAVSGIAVTFIVWLPFLAARMS